MLAASIQASLEVCLDGLNLSQPDLIESVHSRYLQAGARVIQTNSFGANRYKLAQHGLQDQISQINRQAVNLAQQSVRFFLEAGTPPEQVNPGKTRQDGEIFIAGDVGPLGVRLAPYGRVQPEQARQAFSEQIEALAEFGADLIILETFSDLGEILEALLAARAVCDLAGGRLADLHPRRPDRAWGHPCSRRQDAF